MVTEDHEYFSDILDTLKRYQDRHGQILSSKKLKEAVLRVMDEEEEEIERNIYDSKERVDNISDSDKQVEAKSEAKAYRDYI